MTKRRKNHTDIPTLRLHKASGRARVRLNGQDCYVGQYGTVEAEEAYNRLIAQWLMSGRCLPSQPKCSPGHTTTDISDGDGDVITVRELVNQYQAWGEARYTNSSQASVNYYASRPMVDAYGSTPAADFGPNSLRIVRQLMIQRGWCRSSINKRISLIRSVFAWAASREMLPETVHRALSLVEPLAYGCGVRESSKKELVEDSTIESIKPHLSRQVFTIIKLMLLSGCRCGEIVQLRPMDISEVEVDGGVKILEFRPQHHKTEYRGMDKVVRFGPQGALILAPFLNRDADEYCFQPKQAEVERRAKLHELRVTPPSYGNAVGTNRKNNPQRRPGDRYDTATVRRAIQRAVSTYNKQHPETPVPKFSPHQLRHTALTRIRDHFGIEGAMAMGGHHSVGMVELYSGRSTAAARKVAAQAG